MPEGKAVLRINVDETSVCLYQGDVKGTVFVNKRKRPRGGEPSQKASLALKRTCVTHIAFICDRPGLQPLMPQVLVANCHTFQAGEWAELLGTCPANVYLVRQKSSWNNADLFARVIGVLGGILQPYLGELQPVLLMDACRLHLHSAVLRACVGQGLWPLAIPAKLTWLLQPCDTHAFLPYKRCLKESYQRRRAATATGQLSVAEFLPVVYDTIRQKLQGVRWAKAFEEDGFGSGQAALSVYAKRQLALEGSASAGSGRPTMEQLALCFPRRSKVDVATLFRPHQQLALPAPLPLGRRLLPRRPQLALQGQPAASAVSAAANIVPAAPAAAAQAGPVSGPGPVTRAQSRLRAALASGSPVAAVPKASSSKAEGLYKCGA